MESGRTRWRGPGICLRSECRGIGLGGREGEGYVSGGKIISLNLPTCSQSWERQGVELSGGLGDRGFEIVPACYTEDGGLRGLNDWREKGRREKSKEAAAESASVSRSQDRK